MIGSISIALLALYLVAVEPWFGKLAYRRMLAALDTDVPDARRHFYLQWTWQGWALVAVTLAVTLGFAGWTPAQLGLCLPYWPHLPGTGSDASVSLVQGAVVGAGLAVAAGLILGVVLAYRRRRSGNGSTRQPTLAGRRDLMRMLPRTRGERRAFAALAITAGIGEEVVWRGFGLTLLFALLPSLHPAAPIALAAIAFGFAHLYQGAIGVLVTASIGVALATLFWASGSLLWPMLIHVLLDLRVLLIRAPAMAIQGGSR